ncbi:hypothetical protein ASG87_15940 [Frateuria sp. Soil773]|uniref:hypothetical protein n=1 Tax=Frateuria sp. Soil773 TaxID=1736407 RepID=UPI0006FECE3E|nr:hypothetical protein [Frateuria sp. Soil773]KRE96811.1 hypothetical protein ASG87_15940 [Frateuria sp. Soil773]
MNRYTRKGRQALLAATMACTLAGCASMQPTADTGVSAEQRLGHAGSAVAGRPDGWPEAVPLPEGAQIDGYHCTDRYCTLWFGLMDLDQLMALRRGYIKLLKDSGKWEQLGSPSGLYENEAFRYTGAMPSGCGYTLEIRQHSVSNDYHRRFRLSTSLTW